MGRNVKFDNFFRKSEAYPFPSSSGTTLRSEPPTAKMHDCGGLIIAVK